MRLWIACVVVAVAGACDCEGPPARPDPHDADIGDAGQIDCTVDDECALGEQCRGGECVDATIEGGDDGCRGDEDCGPGLLCALSTGQCVLDAPTPGVPAGPPGPCNAGDQRTCGVKVGVCDYGVELCSDDGQWSGVCTGALGPADHESCNGLDDDCDGDADEDFAAVGTACSDGLGACKQDGVVACSNDGSATVCSATALDSTGRVELCGNNLDDDCDGVPDDGFETEGASCSIGSGACAAIGTLECTPDALALTCVATTGGVERCNRVDDTGEGCVDEGFDLGTPCSNGVGVCRRSGVTVCSADGLGVECGAVPALPAAQETCDGDDDNCNNVIDDGCDDDGDGFCDATLAFGAAPVAVCPNSTSASRLDCNDANAGVHPGAAEVCNNGVDEDCDGSLTNGCSACNTGIDADFDGSNQCNDCDETNGSIHPGAAERCDGIDNNCDGRVDEGFDSDGDGFTRCGTRPGGGVDRALIDCNDNAATVNPGACELCRNAAGAAVCGIGNVNVAGNGVDDNCNGFIDEVCSPCDNVDNDGDGFSECAGDCDDTNSAAGRAVHPGAPEICDGLDDDCNKTTIDNCGVSGKCNFDGDGNTGNDADVCEDRLICVQSLSAGGAPTGNFSCTSFCNITAPGIGLGDSCDVDETCGAALTPTDNSHGCAVTSGIGSLAPGTTCSGDSQCRSARCVKDGRFTGNVKYCFDFCGSDAYCPAGTKCQASTASETGQCLRLTALQTLNVGATCTAGTAFECVNGSTTCVSGRCRKPCCSNTDCAASELCSLDGTSAPGPNGGIDTMPVCLPKSGGNGGRPAGAACTQATQCASEFCDTALGICVDTCCNDTSCPTGLTCESELVTLAAGQTFARVCVTDATRAVLEPIGQPPVPLVPR